VPSVGRKHTPLHVACLRGLDTVARVLIKAGADPHDRGEAADSPIELLKAHGTEQAEALARALDALCMVDGRAEGGRVERGGSTQGEERGGLRSCEDTQGDDRSAGVGKADIGAGKMEGAVLDMRGMHMHGTQMPTLDEAKQAIAFAKEGAASAGAEAMVAAQEEEEYFDPEETEAQAKARQARKAAVKDQELEEERRFEALFEKAAAGDGDGDGEEEEEEEAEHHTQTQSLASP